MNSLSWCKHSIVSMNQRHNPHHQSTANVHYMTPGAMTSLQDRMTGISPYAQQNMVGWPLPWIGPQQECHTRWPANPVCATKNDWFTQCLLPFSCGNSMIMYDSYWFMVLSSCWNTGSPIATEANRGTPLEKGRNLGLHSAMAVSQTASALDFTASHHHRRRCFPLECSAWRWAVRPLLAPQKASGRNIRCFSNAFLGIFTRFWVKTSAGE